MASNPAVILEKFTEIARSGKDILHISFSSALSGGYSNIVSGANEVMEGVPGYENQGRRYIERIFSRGDSY